MNGEDIEKYIDSSLNITEIHSFVYLKYLDNKFKNNVLERIGNIFTENVNKEKWLYSPIETIYREKNLRKIKKWYNEVSAEIKKEKKEEYINDIIILLFIKYFDEDLFDEYVRQNRFDLALGEIEEELNFDVSDFFAIIKEKNYIKTVNNEKLLSSTDIILKSKKSNLLKRAISYYMIFNFEFNNNLENNVEIDLNKISRDISNEDIEKIKKREFENIRKTKMLKIIFPGTNDFFEKKDIADKLFLAYKNNNENEFIDIIINIKDSLGMNNLNYAIICLNIYYRKEFDFAFFINIIPEYYNLSVKIKTKITYELIDALSKIRIINNRVFASLVKLFNTYIIFDGECDNPGFDIFISSIITYIIQMTNINKIKFNKNANTYCTNIKIYLNIIKKILSSKKINYSEVFKCSQHDFYKFINNMKKMSEIVNEEICISRFEDSYKQFIYNNKNQKHECNIKK